MRLAGAAAALAAVISTLSGIPSNALAPTAAVAATASGILDDNAASAKAKATGSKVLVDTRTSQTSQVFANPDGSFTAELAVDPVRIRRGGAWIPVDSTLRANADGSISPSASATDMHFSGGGTRPLIEVRRGGVTLDVSWPETLPAPVLHGDTATYVDVYPGVDLEVTATGSGVTHRVVVKTRTAAADPRVRQITYGQKVSGGKKVGRSAGSGFVVTDGFGEAVFESPEALMWDSASGQVPAPTGTTAKSLSKTSGSGATAFSAADTATGTSADPSTNEPREGDNVADLPTQMTADTLTVSPSTTLLDSPSTVFPVSIDPQASPLTSSWAMVDAAYPGVAYSKYAGDQGVGYQDFSAWSRKRLFYGLNTSGLKGTQVSAATFSAFEIYSATCSAGTVDAYLSGDVSAGTTWNNQPGRIGGIQDSFSTKAGRSDCLSGGTWGSWDVTSAVQNRVTAKADVTTIQLAGRSESTYSSWMRFAGPSYTTTSLRPKMSVTYNNPPAATPTSSMKAPTDQTACVTTTTGAPRINTTSSSAYMYAKAYDAQGGSLVSAFQIWNTSGTQVGTNYYTPAFTAAAATWTAYQKAPFTSFTGLTNGTTYYWTVVTKDATSGYVNRSGRCYFVMDISPPAGAPTMTAPVDTDQLLPATQGPVTVTLSHPDAASFAYSVAEVFKGYVTASSGKATISADVSKNVVRVGAQARNAALTLGTGGNLWLNKAVPRRLGVFHFTASAADPANVAAATVGVSTDAALTADWTLPIDESTGLGEGRYAGCDSDSSSTACRNDKALDFAAGASPVALEHRPARTDDSFTVGAWVYVDQNTGASTILQQDGTQGAFQLYYDGNADPTVDADGDGTADADGRFTFAFGTGTARVVAKDGLAAGATGGRVGGWTYVAGTYDKTASTAYPNGRVWVTTVQRADSFSPATQVGGAKVNAAAAGTASTGTFFIGGSGTDSVGDTLNPFLGRIDEISTWQAAYDPAPPTGGTIAYDVRTAATEAAE